MCNVMLYLSHFKTRLYCVLIQKNLELKEGPFLFHMTVHFCHLSSVNAIKYNLIIIHFIFLFSGKVSQDQSEMSHKNTQSGLLFFVK